MSYTRHEFAPGVLKVRTAIGVTRSASRTVGTMICERCGKPTGMWFKGVPTCVECYRDQRAAETTTEAPATDSVEGPARSDDNASDS